jgi:2-polyprenyl-3-methyl-5-hydroxy-6-metoxy-1,4-benzoquinol methylase/ribosomal protein S27AE
MAQLGFKALYERERAIRPPEVMAEGLRLRQAELDALFFDGAVLRAELVTLRTRCPVCGSPDLRAQRPGKRWPLVTCGSCGTLTVHALPTSAAWSQFYSTSRADALFHRKVYEGTKAKRLATVDEPRVRWITERCPRAGTLLDVGCSSGSFLEVLSAQSQWECHGIEPNPEAVKAAHEKGLANVVCTQLEDYSPRVRFDALTFFSTLHQLDDPLQSLLKLRAHLKPDGRIFAADMNFAGFYAAITGEDNLNFAPPMIKTFLDSRNIVTLLETAGFTDVEITTPGQLDVVRVWMYWTQGGVNGRSDALHRMLAHELAADSSRLQDLIVASGASEHMWVTARCR